MIRSEVVARAVEAVERAEWDADAAEARAQAMARTNQVMRERRRAARARSGCLPAHASVQYEIAHKTTPIIRPVQADSQAAA